MAGQFVLLMYDIPDGMGIENPSSYFRQFGVRIRLSDWIFPEDGVPYIYLQEMHRQGVRWDTVRFDTRENGKLIRMAIQAIKEDIAAVRQRTQQSCNRAAQEATDDTASVDTLKAFRKRTTLTLKKMRKALHDLKAVSARFGITDETSDDITQAESYCDNVKGMMLRRAQTLVESIRALETNDPNDPIARQLRDGTIPAEITADYIADTIQTGDGWNRANRLRSAFARPESGSFFD